MSIDYNEVKKNVKEFHAGLKQCPTCGLIYSTCDGMYHKAYHGRVMELIEKDHHFDQYFSGIVDPESLRREAFNASTDIFYESAVLHLIAYYYVELFKMQGANGPYDKNGEIISHEQYIRMWLGANSDMPLPSLKGFGPKSYAYLIQEHGVQSGLAHGSSLTLV